MGGIELLFAGSNDLARSLNQRPTNPPPKLRRRLFQLQHTPQPLPPPRAPANPAGFFPAEPHRAAEPGRCLPPRSPPALSPPSRPLPESRTPQTRARTPRTTRAPFLSTCPVP